MAWTSSALPRSVGALAEAIAAYLGVGAALDPADKSRPCRHILIAAAAHLAVFGLMVSQVPDEILTSLMIAGALLTGLLALTLPSSDAALFPRPSHPPAFAAATPPDGRAMPDCDAPSPQIVLTTQSPALAGAADPATFSRPEIADRGKAFTDLMARVSHEIRTPLNAVIGFSDLMAQGVFGPLGHARYEEYLDHIRASGRELLKSAEDTLALTSLLADPKPREGLAACDLGDLAADSWRALATGSADKQVTLDIRAPAGVEVFGDRRALRQILVNLFSAALGRAGRGTTIVLDVVADADIVRLDIRVPAGSSQGASGAGTLATCLARALLELQGTSLLEFTTEAGAWKAVTILNRAVQPDFFGRPAATHASATVQ